MQIGDRVKCIKNYDYNGTITGKIGTIIGFKDSLYNGNLLAVAFDNNVGGHSCKGRCVAGYGWNLPEGHLELIKPKIETARESVMF